MVEVDPKLVKHHDLLTAPPNNLQVRPLSVQTSDNHIVTRYYVAFSENGGTVTNQPRILSPTGWVCSWQPVLCTDGTVMFAIEASRATADMSTQTVEDDVVALLTDTAGATTAPVANTMDMDRSSNSSGISGVYSIASSSSTDSGLGVSLLPDLSRCKLRINGGPIIFPKPPTGSSTPITKPQGAAVLRQTVLVQPPGTTALRPILPKPPTAAPAVVVVVPPLQQPLDLTATASNPSPPLPLRPISSTINMSSLFARIFDGRLLDKKRPKIFIRDTLVTGQCNYYVCLPLIGGPHHLIREKRNSTNNTNTVDPRDIRLVAEQQFMKLPFGPRSAAQMPNLSRLLMAHRNRPEHQRNDPEVPTFPRLCRFKSSLPKFKFIRNHMERATMEQARIGPVNVQTSQYHPSPTDPWIGHYSVRRPNLAVLNRCVPDATYDQLIYRLLKP
jgi:hypothetical protein